MIDDIKQSSDPPEDLSPFALEWLKGKTARDFDVMEHVGRVYWPVQLQRRRRGPDKKPIWKEEPALLRVLDPMDKIRGVEIATRYFDAQGFKIDDARHQAIWSEIEKVAMISIALREAVDAQTGKPYPEDAEPHPKAAFEDMLNSGLSGITASEVSRLWEVHRVFDSFESARLEKVDKDLAIRVALAINDTRSLSPLVVFDGPALDSYVMYTAEILSSCLRGEPSPPLPAKSTREP